VIPPEGEIVDLNTTEKSIWASRLVDCHGDATREEVKDAPAKAAPPMAELGNDQTRARAKGKEVSDDR
jgi:hypothetical protein